MASGKGEDDQRNGYADGEGAQHGAFLLPEVAWRRTATPSALRAHLWLFVACNRLIGVTSAGQIVAS